MEEQKSLESSLSHTEIHDSRTPKAEPAAPEPDGEAPIAGSVKPDHPVEDDYEYVTGFKLATIIGCVTLVAFLILLDQSIIATVRHAPPSLLRRLSWRQAIPRITSDFHSLPDVGWYGSAYLLARSVRL